jgi:multiple sugar transport system substrate-binding protein
MYEKGKDLASAFVARRLGRRELVRRMGQLGLTVAGSKFLLNQASTAALAADFDWKKHQGTKLNLLMNKHPYMDALVADLDNFKALTGMEVSYDVFPEDVYFDKVTAALSSGSSQYDAFMTGAYQTWQYGPAGWLVDMAEFINDPALTAPNYDWEDILPNLRASTAWSGVPGAELGGEGAKQWAIPWGFELNSLSYNQRIFEQAGIAGPPKDLAELLEQAAKITTDIEGVYGVGVRGSRSWATIHPGYLSGFSNYGARDFEVADGKLLASMNSDAGKQFTRQWVEMIKQSGPRDWSTYTWYQVGTDLGAGASGMIYDATVIPAQHFTLSVMFVPPGQGNAPHTHEVEEVFFILEGKVLVFIEDGAGNRAETVLGAWDCVSCPANVIHGFTNVGLEPAYLQVMLGKARPELMTYTDGDLQSRRDEHLRAAGSRA